MRKPTLSVDEDTRRLARALAYVKGWPIRVVVRAALVRYTRTYLPADSIPSLPSMLDLITALEAQGKVEVVS